MKLQNKLIIFLLVSIGAIAIGLFLAITLGALKVDLTTIWNSLFHFENTLEMQIVRDIRIPRAICSFFVGGLLGMSGALMQGTTRNPLAEPSLLGISQGAIFVMALVFAFQTLPSSGMILGATFFGALAVGVFILLVISLRPENMAASKLLLIGNALSVFFTSLSSIIALLTNNSQLLAFWVAGGLRSSNWNNVLLIAIVAVFCFILALFIAPKINVLSLGDDTAVGLGVNPFRTRMKALIIVIISTAACVAVSGNIGFVGLIIPYITKRVVSSDFRYLIPCSFLLGAALLVFADVFARLIISPYELPIGIFTALLGVPFYLILIRKENN